MYLKLKPTSKKVKAGYKTLYITDELAGKVEEIAKNNNTSFNNVVISILEEFFCKDKQGGKEMEQFVETAAELIELDTELELEKIAKEIAEEKTDA